MFHISYQHSLHILTVPHVTNVKKQSYCGHIFINGVPALILLDKNVRSFCRSPPRLVSTLKVHLSGDHCQGGTVLLQLYVLFLFSADNDQLKQLCCLRNSWMRSLWAKKLRSRLGDLHSFLIVCELYSPMRSASSLTKSNSLAHFDRLCRFTLSRYDISPNFAQSTKPRKWSNLAFIWSLLSKIKQSACLCSSLITCLTLFPLPVRPSAPHFYSNQS